MGTPGVGFVGSGRIARIILAGWRRANCAPSPVVASDCDAAALERLVAEFPTVTATPDNRAAAAQPVVFIAVHPPAFPAVLAEIRDSLQAGSIVVSLAPRWSIGRIREVLGGFDGVARVIPNAPSLVNKGYNPLSFSAGLAASERAMVRDLFTPLGACPEVSEETLEAYAIVAAMGPTYFWYQFYQLIDLGCEFGLSREAATEAVVAMADGAIGTMTASELGPEGVIDLIPVKPLAGIEQTVRQSYVDTLSALHRKLTG